MAEEQQTPVVEAAKVEDKTKEQATATTPAVAEKTETPAEHMIPKSRLDEVNAKLKSLEEEATKQAKAAAKAEEERLAHSAEWQKLADQRKAKIDELSPKAELADKLTEMVAAQYEAAIKDWPDEVRGMAPGDDASILTKLDWMNKAKAAVAKLTGDKEPTPGNGRGPRVVGNATNAQNSKTQAEWQRQASKRYR